MCGWGEWTLYHSTIFIFYYPVFRFFFRRLSDQPAVFGAVPRDMYFDVFRSMHICAAGEITSIGGSYILSTARNYPAEITLRERKYVKKKEGGQCPPSFVYDFI